MNDGAVRRDEPKELVLRPLATAADAGSDWTMASRHVAGASSSSRVGVPTVVPVAVRDSSSSAAGTGGTLAGSGPGSPVGSGDGTSVGAGAGDSLGSGPVGIELGSGDGTWLGSLPRSTSTRAAQLQPETFVYELMKWCT